MSIFIDTQMYKGVECEYNKEKCFFDAKQTKTRILTPTNTIEIENDTITNIYTKDSSSGENAFLMKITGKESLVVAFKSVYIRDFYKSFFTCIIKENIERQNQKTTKSLQLNEEENIANSENPEHTKMQMIKYVIDKPLLLTIFYEINCTMTQFFNYIRQSYFFNINNTKNVIDRLLNEKTREYKNCDDNFATRINTHSFLQLTNEAEIDVAERELIYTEVDFCPIFAEKEEYERKKINDFEFPEAIDLKISFDYVIEQEEVKKAYDKKALIRLVELCRKMHNTSNEDTKQKQDILKEASQYSMIFSDPNLKTFNPANYDKK